MSLLATSGPVELVLFAPLSWRCTCGAALAVGGACAPVPCAACGRVWRARLFVDELRPAPAPVRWPEVVQ